MSKVTFLARTWTHSGIFVIFCLGGFIDKVEASEPASKNSTLFRTGSFASASDVLGMLTDAETQFQKGDLAKAAQNFQKVSEMPDALAHHRWEAKERLETIQRLQNNQPPRDTQASRVKLAPISSPNWSFHVSPKGSDTNPGNADQPFATLEKARDAIRKLAKQAELPAIVFIHGGNYIVDRTFTLKDEDSGTEKAPVVYRAVPGETPRFVGGFQLKGWKQLVDKDIQQKLPEESRDKIVWVDLKANGVLKLLPLQLGGFASGRGFKTHPAHELFFNGKAQQLARWPNNGFIRIKDVAIKDGTKGYDRQGSKIGLFTCDVDRLDRWSKEADLLLYGYWFWDWADSYEMVKSINAPQKMIELKQPFHGYGYSVGAPFYAINALSEIDVPGEWYLDRKEDKVYLYPPSDPESATIELSCFNGPMVRLNNVSHVRFEHITWDLGSADAIIVNDGKNCVFAGCTVSRFAGNGIEIHGGTQHGILSCDVHSLGRGGTIITGGDRKTLTPGNHYIENCEVSDLSRIDHTYTPAVLMNGVGNRIIHNRFHDILSSAMRIEGNDHHIEYNEIFNVVRESDDQGGADMFGNPTYRGNVFRYNYWHHIGNWDGAGENPKCGQTGIRLDDAICGTVIYGNIFERCSVGKLGFGGVQIHGGKENIVDNNLFVDCSAAVSFSIWNEKRWLEFVNAALDNPQIDKTLYLKRYPDLALLKDNANVNHIWRNVALRCGEWFRRSHNRIDAIDNTQLAEMQFKPAADCPAFRQPGFAPIPVDEIGLYTDSYRKKLQK